MRPHIALHSVSNSDLKKLRLVEISVSAREAGYTTNVAFVASATAVRHVTMRKSAKLHCISYRFELQTMAHVVTNIIATIQFG